MTVLAKVCTFLNGNLTLIVVSLLLTSIKSVLTWKGIWPEGGTDFIKVKRSSFPSINQARILYERKNRTIFVYFWVTLMKKQYYLFPSSLLKVIKIFLETILFLNFYDYIFVYSFI